jgi:hypothetical protein
MGSNSIWSWVKLPVFLGSSLAGLGGGALYYYQKSDGQTQRRGNETTDHPTVS